MLNPLYAAMELPSPYPPEEFVEPVKKEEVKPVKEEAKTSTKKGTKQETDVKPAKKEEGKKEEGKKEEGKKEEGKKASPLVILKNIPFPSRMPVSAFSRATRWEPAAPDQTEESVSTLTVTYTELFVLTQLPEDVVNKNVVDHFLPNLLFRLEGRRYAVFCALSGDGFSLRQAVWRVGACFPIDDRCWRCVVDPSPYHASSCSSTPH